MSPEGLYPSFKRELIHKEPHFLKIKLLREIKNLFTIENPLYAGFGNKETVFN